MKECKRLIIAIDGYSSTGKSTVAKQLAARLGYAYIDTGAMYRAVTLEALRRGILRGEEVAEEGLRRCLTEIHIDFKYNEEKGCSETYLNGENVEGWIRGMEVSDHVSRIAALGFVREFLVEQQRELGHRGGVVMDGRDIGSVVFPQAEVKFFMTASPEIRAERRYKELVAKGESVTYEEVEKNVRERDYLDEHRAVGPLKKTEDAVLIDNSGMTVEAEIKEMLRIVRERC